MKNFLSYLLFLSFGVILMAESEWQLVWSDEFDYEGAPLSENWTALEGYLGFNEELQRYTSDLRNASVANGLLRIEAHIDRVPYARFREIKETLKSFGGNYKQLSSQEVTSARLVSAGKREFSNAKVEVRARFSDTRGTWPAIWLLGDESKRPWPDCGEIDIMEHVGYDPNVIHSSVHTKDYNFRERNHSTKKTKVRSVEDFHVYGVEWSEDQLEFSLDGAVYHVLERGDRDTGNWPFAAEDKYHVILNIAVGGSWGGIKGLRKSSTVLPYWMEIDYVRVYEKSAP